MKLIPFLRFGGSRGEEEQSDDLNLPPEELIELPVDEDTEEDEEEEEKMEDEENKDEPEGAPMNDDSAMLKVFMTVEEEFVDNSGLAAQIEDVSADELVQELRVLASAFGIRVDAALDEAV